MDVIWERLVSGSGQHITQDFTPPGFLGSDSFEIPSNDRDATDLYEGEKLIAAFVGRGEERKSQQL